MLLSPDPAPPSAAVPLRERLRRETAAAHARLESHLDLLQSPPRPAHLRRVLAGFLGFHRVWEPSLAARLEAPDFTTPRERATLLIADLQALGLSDTEIAALPDCAAAAGLCEGRGRSLGSLYVMQGSTLGGRVISRHLGGACALPPEGLQYFDPHGPKTGSMWAESLHWIGELGQAESDAAVAGALDTFDLLLHWLPAAALPDPAPSGSTRAGTPT